MSIALQEFDVQQFRAEIVKMSDARARKGARAQARPAFPLNLFLFPPWLDASQYFPGLLDIAIRPEAYFHGPEVQQWRRFDRSRRNVTLEC
jgi:hypothetical protein